MLCFSLSFFFFTHFFSQLHLVSFSLSLFLLLRSMVYFFVSLSSTFYWFIYFSICGIYLGWYGILMVISSFWSDLWAWSLDLRCGCGCRVQICGVTVVGLDLRCGGHFSLFLYGFIYVCLRGFWFLVAISFFLLRGEKTISERKMKEEWGERKFRGCGLIWYCYSSDLWAPQLLS